MEAQNSPASIDPPTPVMSLIIPCFNEALNLPLLISRIDQSFDPSLGVEVVLIDNGSTDDSPNLLASLLANHGFIRSVRVEENRGYGFGILTGLKAARGQFMGWTHADLQTDPADALRALELINSSATPETLYVKGKRGGRSLVDVVFTIGMSVFESILLRRGLWDINAQPNIFSRAFFEGLAAEAPHDFSLDLYFYHAAKQAGMSVVRFPVHFGERAHGVSHWNVDWRGKRKFIERTIKFSLELRRNLAEKKRTAHQ